MHGLIRSGKIGKVTVARAYRISNMYPLGIGSESATKPVEGLDWDMWLGPRQQRDYKDNITPYKFRWWESYSSQMGNWGVHYCDAIRWMLDDQAPTSISAHGGSFAVEDDRTVPDTMEVIFEMPSKSLVIFGQYEACGGSALARRRNRIPGDIGQSLHGSGSEGVFHSADRGRGSFKRTRPPSKPRRGNVSTAI